jgi:hypothetical protein
MTLARESIAEATAARWSAYDVMVMIPPKAQYSSPDEAQPVPVARPVCAVERWTTILILIVAGMIYVSVFLQSISLFLIGEVTCLALSPIIVWFERARIRQWWNERDRCPACQCNLRGFRRGCPQCDGKI